MTYFQLLFTPALIPVPVRLRQAAPAQIFGTNGGEPLKRVSLSWLMKFYFMK